MAPADLNTLASGCFQGFSEKKRLNARGFTREFFWSCMLYRPGKSLKRRAKSSSLHKALQEKWRMWDWKGWTPSYAMTD